MERGLAIYEEPGHRGRPRPELPMPERAEVIIIAQDLFLKALCFFIPFLAALCSINCAPCPAPVTCPAVTCPKPELCPVIPVAANFSWMEYIPHYRHGVLGDDHGYAAWNVFNASDAAASWANPLLPTQEESIICRRRIQRSSRQLRALWHPDRVAESGLRRVLDLSDKQLLHAVQVLNQAYNDAIFGCMTAEQKSTWVNALTDKSSVEWETLDAFDVTEQPVPAVDAAHPSDLGLDLTTREFVHIIHCMERQDLSWAEALHMMRAQRHTLWWFCRSSVEPIVDFFVSSAPRGTRSAFQRSLRRQQVVDLLMKRTGAFNGCVDKGDADGLDTRPWWEREDADEVQCIVTSL